MRRRSKLALSPWLVLANLLPMASARLSDKSTSPSINLSQFQPIYGFSPACTTAYDTPIPGCTASDFTGTDPCSASCIDGLDQITALLDSACQNTEADPSTLIGLFFAGKGVAALCLNAGGSTTAQASSTGVGASSPSSTMLVSSVTTPSTTTPSSIGTPSSSASFALRPSSTSSNTPSSTSTSAATMSRSALSSSAASHSSLTSITGSSGSSAPQPTKTASSNPDQFGGGGSPFEISSEATSRKIMSWMLYGLEFGLFVSCFV